MRRPIVPVLAVVVAAACRTSTAALPAAPEPSAPASPDEAAIARREVCIGSSVESAGDLADVLYYRYASLPTGELVVGYYAFFSEERPWGNNWLTWTVIPALAVDMVYTRALLLAPGIQRLAYGKGDVEGVRVVYEREPGGDLRAREALADDGDHAPVWLDARAIFRVDADRPTFYSDVWSHQLGGRSARSSADLAYRRCYSGKNLVPLTPELAAEFHLERRARPAAVGAIAPSREGAPRRALALQSQPAARIAVSPAAAHAPAAMSSSTIP